MSDGPLYSPSMSKPSRRLAESCGNDASSTSERIEKMEDVALHAYKKEAGEKTLDIINAALHSLEGDLFEDNRSETLEAVRNDISPCAFSQSLLDNVIEATHDGLSTFEAMEVGLGNAFSSRIHSEGRAIVEHCLDSSEVSSYMASKVATNLNEASNKIQARSLAEHVIENGVKSRANTYKRSSVDEGPRL